MPAHASQHLKYQLFRGRAERLMLQRAGRHKRRRNRVLPPVILEPKPPVFAPRSLGAMMLRRRRCGTVQSPPAGQCTGDDHSTGASAGPVSPFFAASAALAGVRSNTAQERGGQKSVLGSVLESLRCRGMRPATGSTFHQQLEMHHSADLNSDLSADNSKQNHSANIYLTAGSVFGHPGVQRNSCNSSPGGSSEIDLPPSRWSRMRMLSVPKVRNRGGAYQNAAAAAEAARSAFQSPTSRRTSASPPLPTGPLAGDVIAMDSLPQGNLRAFHQELVWLDPPEEFPGQCGGDGAMLPPRSLRAPSPPQQQLQSESMSALLPPPPPPPPPPPLPVPSSSIDSSPQSALVLPIPAFIAAPVRVPPPPPPTMVSPFRTQGPVRKSQVADEGTSSARSLRAWFSPHHDESARSRNPSSSRHLPPGEPPASLPRFSPPPALSVPRQPAPLVSAASHVSSPSNSGSGSPKTHPKFLTGSYNPFALQGARFAESAAPSPPQQQEQQQQQQSHANLQHLPVRTPARRLAVRFQDKHQER